MRAMARLDSQGLHISDRWRGIRGRQLATVTIDVGEGETHEYASGITVGEVVRNVHGKRSGAVAAEVDATERDMSHILDLSLIHI